MTRSILFLLVLFLAGCASARLDDRPREVGVVEEEGRIVFVDREDGFFGIETDGGARFVPDGIEAEFVRDGVRVRFRGRVLENLVTLEMWGTPILIERMEEI